jgi:hypothetical protein
MSESITLRHNYGSAPNYVKRKKPLTGFRYQQHLYMTSCRRTCSGMIRYIPGHIPVSGTSHGSGPGPGLVPGLAQVF